MRTLFAPHALTSGELALEASEAHHGRSVLRLGLGDHCRVIDGLGAEAEAQVQSVDRHGMRLTVAPPQRRPPPASHMLSVALAAPKGARLDDVLRGLVELAVGEVIFFGSERACRLPAVDRLQRVAREALKQSRGCHMPRITVIENFASWQPQGRVILLDPKGKALAIGAPQPTILVIGPEGGLSANEELRLIQGGAHGLRLVSTILRIETAAIAATAVVAHAWEHHV